MFDSIGWGEIVVLALAALFIFGPDRLPTLAKDAASGLKKAREAVTGVRGQLHETLGDDFDHLRDIDLRQYHPKTFIRSQLMGDDDAPARTGSTAAGATAAGATAAGARATAGQMTGSRDASTPPPFDVDAT
ncbi:MULTISPECIES: twin-arginine translocase TatA/TatE family subunit [unclassified Modestobacter]|uniref:twin-arginine translocase TatA/TatE family subunit n=1 Tax=unclassified Modestobacter TaxID=2643866 RepID=UPI0022AB0D7C|nr:MULTISPECIES: twin-arginine translocase TatA/TatE family subunit [unclassified Modestobacter]MCZ2824161.1 twin-arginine translocase TatA/TatE family subunit [Modestobacter sp. VKM Ac-2981]MCZ2836660.1 twin-arginine translocase TatA/TatE family subunit [Modestobacter sp. VKM Ac-2985]MCZ2854311.1 twin-arginine translocase TatA/TatE family subunit [Modestobacter sp. VKM Ac-2982]